jgi:hypothetical protein
MIGALAATSLVAAGCGGAATPDPGASATPGATTPGGTVGATTPADPAAAGQPGATDPTTGAPVTDSATSALTQTVPVLSGGDVAGGLSAVTASPVFDARAGTGEQLATSTSSDTSATSSETTTAKSTTTYTGAKIYVDGITYSVNRNATFPKGNPVFKLLSVNGSSVEIELVAGEFTSDGGDGTFLDKGDLVSFVNASEQVTYKVKYLRPIVQSSDLGF